MSVHGPTLAYERSEDRFVILRWWQPFELLEDRYPWGLRRERGSMSHGGGHTSKVLISVGALVLSTAGLSLWDAGPAVAVTGGYPWAAASCATPAKDGSCSGYNWGYPDPQHSTPGLDIKGSNGGWWQIYNPTTGGYGYRNCTDWVAWRLESFGISVSIVKSLGNGGQWAANAPKKGLSVTSTPEAGMAAIQVGNPGHVAFVESVSGSRITVSEYNYHGTGTYDERTGTPATLGFSKFVNFGVSSGVVGLPGPSAFYDANSGLPAVAVEGPGNQLDYDYQMANGSWGQAVL
jgi:hypothetical protein